jgi:hypothetical protein
MIIHQPQIVIENGEVVVSAKIDYQSPQSNFADQLWYAFPEQYQTFITDRVDGFVVALLIFAMMLGENIEVKSPISPKLADGIYRYQQFLNYWFPEKLKLIDINCSDYQPLEGGNIPGKVGSSFSGGLDSFYTLWSHLPENQRIPQFQISHLLFIHGFDLPLKEEETYRIAYKAYHEMSHKLGIELISARTNARSFSGGNWELSHGAILTSFALVLGKFFSRYYIPSTHTYSDLFPWGSDPRSDHFLSTESLDIVHDQANLTRFEKAAVIAKWQESYSRLRVCWVKPDGLKNCCRCNKCIRTMISLEILGELDKFETFPLKLERHHIRAQRIMNENDNSFMQQILEAAKVHNRSDIKSELEYAFFRSSISKLVSKFR